MRKLGRGLAVIATGLSVFGCDSVLPARYAAEVGYYHGEEIRWEIWGDFQSLEACRNEAISRYNWYFRKEQAQSWSCLKKNGKGGYASRHR
jgi:hypothetical protein